VEARRPGLADRLQASLWWVELAGVDPADAAEAVAAFMAADSVEVERVTKKGRRRFDTRSAVVHIDVSGDTAESESEGRHAAYAILHTVVRHTQPAVRPNDVLTGLRHVADLAPPSSTTVTRLAQGPLDEATGSIADPLTVDRIDAQATSTGTADPYAEERREHAPQPSAFTAGPSR